jgi:hypothetical protein
MQADAESQRESNVNGTRQALALARALKVGCFHQVSSIAAAGLYEGTFTEDMFEEAGDHGPPLLSHQARIRGAGAQEKKQVPWRIYRPGMVVGHSQTGEMDKIDGPYYFFGLLHELSKVTPRWLPLVMNKAGLLNIVPVDLPSTPWITSRTCRATTTSAFSSPTPRAYASATCSAHPAWRPPGDRACAPSTSGVVDKATRSPARVSAAWAPAFPRREGAVALGIPPQVIGYINYPTRFDSDEDPALLAEAGIECPPSRILRAGAVGLLAALPAPGAVR